MQLKCHYFLCCFPKLECHYLLCCFPYEELGKALISQVPPFAHTDPSWAPWSDSLRSPVQLCAACLQNGCENSARYGSSWRFRPQRCNPRALLTVWVEEMWREGQPWRTSGKVALLLLLGWWFSDSPVCNIACCTCGKCRSRPPPAPPKHPVSVFASSVFGLHFFRSRPIENLGVAQTLLWQTSVLMISANKDISRRQFIRWNKSIWAGICSKKLCFSLKPQIKHRSLYKNKGSLKFGKWLKGRPSGWTKVTHPQECSPRKANCMENIKCNPKESLKILERS